MRATSLRDLMVAECLAHIPSEAMLVSPENDKLVASVLEQIGYDVKQKWEYIPSRHRDMQNKIDVGYMVVGEFSRDPKYRHFLDTTDRIICAGATDASMAVEMSNLLGKKHTYRGDEKWDDGSRAAVDDPRYFSDSELLALGFTQEDEEAIAGSGDYIEEDWEDNLRNIKALDDWLVGVRKGVDD
jgi:hypothetical protein